MGNGTTTTPLPITADPSTQDTEAEQEKQGVGYAALSDAQKEWLDQMSKVPFIPWPNEDDMRRGALSTVQMMIAQGQDPTKALSAAELEERDRKMKEQSDEVKMEQQRKSSIGRPAAPAGPKEEVEQTFNFGLYNPEDDEEDEE